MKMADQQKKKKKKNNKQWNTQEHKHQ